jgi:DNA primase
MASIKVKDQFVQIDLLQLMSDYGIKGKQIGNEFVAFCPFHEDRSPSWSIKLDGERAGLWHCMSSTCELKGNIITLITMMENCGYKEAIASLVASEAETKVEEKDLDSIVRRLLSMGLDISQKDLRYPLPLDCTKAYVKTFLTNSKPEGGRSYSEYDAEQLIDSVWYCESGFFRNKIIIPIYNEDGEQISFVARTLDSKILEKYRYPRGWKKNLFVYRMESNPSDHYAPIICEGIFDGLHIQKIWNRTALVVFGSSLTTAQVSWIAKRYGEVTLCLDSDTAGRNGAYKAIRNMQQFGVNANVMELPDGSDPPCISRQEMTNIELMEADEWGNKWEQGHMLKRFCRSGSLKSK